MKKRISAIAATIALTALVTSCASTANKITLSAGDTPIASSPNENVTASTYQKIYDDLYAQNGPQFALTEIVYQIGRDLFIKSGRDQKEWDERVEKEINDAFLSAYVLDDEYNEELFASSLKSQGYNIVCSARPFKGTAEHFPKYGSVASALTCDYSDYARKKLDPKIAEQFLREEYILSQKPIYFDNKIIRRMQYFTFSPLTYVDQDKYSAEFASYVTSAKSSDFESLVLGENGLDAQWRKEKRDDIEEEFALIDYTLSSEKYKDRYKNIFDMTEHNSTLKASLISEVEKYSDSGARSIFKGYAQRLMELENKIYYRDIVGTNEGDKYIADDIDKKIFKKDEYLLRDDYGYLRVQQGSDSICHHAANSAYYIVKVTPIDAKSTLAEKRLGAQALARNPSNSKNAVAYYLEQYGVKIREPQLNDRVTKNYGYKSEK